jgi:RimJ/RimL family protein N-acetyltransferase
MAPNPISVRVRPLVPGDSALVADVFARLSPASRLARFLVPKWRLTGAELRYLTEVDHHDHEALIAVTRLGGEPVGVARFVRDSTEPTSAEVAVEVVDDWQGRGVGSLLVGRLARRARREGITQFTALMSADNTRSRRLLSMAGHLTLVERDGATVSYRVALPVLPARDQWERSGTSSASRRLWSSNSWPGAGWSRPASSSCS